MTCSNASITGGVLARIELATGVVTLAPRVDGAAHSVSVTAEVSASRRANPGVRVGRPRRGGIGVRVLFAVVGLCVLGVVRVVAGAVSHLGACGGSSAPTYASSPPPRSVSSASARLRARMEREFTRYPTLMARLDGLGYAQGVELGDRLSARGIGRLSDAELVRMTQIRLRAMDLSPGFCAAQWTSGDDEATILGTLGRLEQADLDAWCEITTRAMSLELGPRVERWAAVADIEPAVMAYLATRPGEQPRWERTVGLDAPSEDDACFLARTLFSAAAALPPDQAGPLLRAMNDGE